MRRALVLALFLAGCAEEPAPTVVEAPVANEPPTVVVPTTGMDADVAALIDAGWDTLRQSLAATDVDAASKAEAYATFGLLCFGNGLTPTAESAFENAVYLMPDESRWIYFLALIHQFTGELELAANGFERVLELDQGQFAAAIRLGDVRYEQADTVAAKIAYERALSNEEYQASAYYGLGRIADAEGDTTTAIASYERVLDAQPNADRIHYLLGLAWRNAGDLEKAEENLARFGTAEPSFPDPLFDEISGGATQIGGLWANMNAGSQAFVDGDLDLAVEKFQQATVDHPNDPRSWESLGMALRRQGELPGAGDAYRKAVELSPDNGELAVTFAEVLVDQSDAQGALDALRTAAANNATDATVRMAFGMMLSQVGNSDAAIPEIEAAITHAETDDIRARAQYSLGRVQVANGNIDLAQAAFSAALASNPGHGGARLELARVYVRGRDFTSALASYRTYLENNPRYDVARIEAATAAIYLNDVAQARELLSDGVAEGEASPRQLSSLARLLVLVTDPSVRDPERALEHANEALKQTGARRHAETLALCLAALGLFDDAVRVQSEVLADAEQQGDAAVRDRAARNLEAYRLRRMGRLPLDAG
ncbi:MAG: tetratricopeptide repeat protein [Pseudomonadota bacterium]